MAENTECKCLHVAGDSADNLVLFVFGHRPGCHEFKIDPREFQVRMYAQAEEIAERILARERAAAAAIEPPKPTPEKSPAALTEGVVQAQLFNWLSRKSHRWIIPNFTAFATGEMDLCSVTKAGMVHEFEIKISRSDFRADLKKATKHGLFERVRAGETHHKYGWAIHAPNYFSYVMPNGMVDVAELPDHAGFVEFYGSGSDGCVLLNVVKKAPKLHNRPMPDEIKEKIAQSLMFRFWKMKRDKYAQINN